MHTIIFSLALPILLLPLLGALLAGLLGPVLGRRATHCVTISFMALAFLLSCLLVNTLVIQGHPSVEANLYQWVDAGAFHFSIGLLLDRLSAVMVFIVCFISLAVHIYTIGYMADDPGYQRFFSYVSLFTFAMLTLVLANNFLLLFFGWEGVGLVSYLLIGFWFNRESAVFGSLKAFLVNRVGDVAFILGIAAILMYVGDLNFYHVFAKVPAITGLSLTLFPSVHMSVITLICLLLFIGAMAKSAQVPLHVWLPESMEGPTPISALIHAATMVTAGIYLVARMSPLFEYSPAVLSVILVLGATTCLFMGILAVFHHDIKRVIAYSTLSQLGYMAIALGASSYDAAIFHLVTHAFFKALLFLCAGSVIIALHHEQDMRQMGGLARSMPITYLTFAIGAFALAAIPPFAGFYSKDAIIAAVAASTLPGAQYAYVAAMCGAFITPLYIFRAFFLTFHGETHWQHGLQDTPRESPWVVLLPLLALAVPSVMAGGLLIGPMLFNTPHLLGDSVMVLPAHQVLNTLAAEYHGATLMALHAGTSLTLWLTLAGILVAWLFTLGFPHWGLFLKKRFHVVYIIINKKYGFDDFNQLVLVHGCRRLGNYFYHICDLKLIDSWVVNGSGRLIQWFARIARRMQTGYLYHYAMVMVLGLVCFLAWFVLGI